MKIILLKDVSGQGKRGDVKEVSEGYAHNFLLPKGLAVAATEEILRKLAKEAKEAAEKDLREVARLKNLKTRLENNIFELFVKVGEKGQVYGSVHEKDVIVPIVSKLGVSLEKNQVELSSAIKQIGEHRVKVRLGHGIIAIVRVNLIAK